MIIAKGQWIVKKVRWILVALVGLWVTLSYVMMWPPICHYEGESFGACMGNLRMIDGAKQQYALETGKTNGPLNVALFESYLKGGRAPVCPSGGTYTYGDLGRDPVCSLATNAIPPPAKERVGIFGWRWRVWPTSGPASHKL